MERILALCCAVLVCLLAIQTGIWTYRAISPVKARVAVLSPLCLSATSDFERSMLECSVK